MSILSHRVATRYALLINQHRTDLQGLYDDVVTWMFDNSLQPNNPDHTALRQAIEGELQQAIRNSDGNLFDYIYEFVLSDEFSLRDQTVEDFKMYMDERESP
jgi:hypothetical protein